MVLALRHPELVERLCVVDVSPVAYDHLSEFEGYVAAMQGLDLASLTRRSDADAALSAAVPDATVRAFLLQNLHRDGERWRWRVNLDVLGEALPEIGGWPESRLAGLPPYEGAVLWVAGSALRLRRAGVPRRHGPLVPPQPQGHDQGRRPLGPFRAAEGVRRGAAAVRRGSRLGMGVAGAVRRDRRPVAARRTAEAA